MLRDLGLAAAGDRSGEFKLAVEIEHLPITTEPRRETAAFLALLMAGREKLLHAADGAELDVHLTRDGEVVVFHDEALKPEIVRGADGRWLDRAALSRDIRAFIRSR